jgi:hypothetical protein
MPSESLKHDVAWATAAHVIEVFSPLLRDDEKREAFHAVYERIKAGLAYFEMKSDRIRKRLGPSKN